MTTPVEFAERCTSAAADLAKLYASELDEKMFASLHQIRENLAHQLSEIFGAQEASLIAEAFVAAVASRRRELMLN